MKQHGNSWLGYLCAFCAIVGILITCIDVVCFNRDFFASEYSDMNTAEQLEMSQADMMVATSTLLDYLEDKKDEIQVEIVVREMARPAFNERESLHMVDVKNLYQFALDVRLGCGIIAILSFVCLLYQKRKDVWSYLALRYIHVAIFFVMIVAMLGIWVVSDFNGFWTAFHKVAFSNDLWLLNPRTDLMINMFPEAFFNHMVMRITISFSTIFIGVLLLSLWYMNHQYHFFTRKEKAYETNYISK